MDAPNRYMVRVVGPPAAPACVTNVHVGDRFVYTGRIYDENLERDFVLNSDDDQRECTEFTTLKLIASYVMEFAPRPRGVRGANKRLRHPQMQYKFERVNDEDIMHEETTKNIFKCTVSVYDLKHMINNGQLCKIPGTSRQIASVGRQRASGTSLVN